MVAKFFFPDKQIEQTMTSKILKLKVHDADLKLSLYVRVHIKIMLWKFRFLNL